MNVLGMLDKKQKHAKLVFIKVVLDTKCIWIHKSGHIHKMI